VKLRIYKALAWGVVLESIRRKDLWVVAILGFLIIVGAGALGIFGVEGLSIFIKDLAAGVLGLFSMIVAALVSTRLLPEEIKQRTLYPLLARPVSRLDLLVGKLCGAIAVTWLSFALLALVTALALVSFHIPLTAIMLQYLFLKMLGLAVVCSIGVALSTFVTPQAAATFTLIFALGSSALGRALFMAGAGSPALRPLLLGLSYIIPEIHWFDIGGRATYDWSPVSLGAVISLVMYALLYTAAMLTLGWLRFRKKAV
jgi:ABC-type transport system involved in multi-copper enzyme maturation permease subunit